MNETMIKAQKEEAVRQELRGVIDRDLKRRGVDRFDPLPRARNASVLPDLIPTTGNVLIPLGRTISRFGMMLRLLKPGL
jgi:hypothetical protein